MSLTGGVPKPVVGKCNWDRPVYCCDCARWYSTGADQCNIPNPGFLTECRIEHVITDKNDPIVKAKQEERERFLAATGKKAELEKKIKDAKGLKFFSERCLFVHFCSDGQTHVYGNPSKLNYDNTCYFFKPRAKLFREQYVSDLINGFKALWHKIIKRRANQFESCAGDLDHNGYHLRH